MPISMCEVLLEQLKLQKQNESSDPLTSIKPPSVFDCLYRVPMSAWPTLPFCKFDPLISLVKESGANIISLRATSACSPFFLSGLNHTIFLALSCEYSFFVFGT